ncbi:hypothetical protein [Chitinophaga sp. 212800010-3]|uniref:hypothetical protein n=1 Tax=unclassified Chitinophaga TaxID=2619133 RepID=UPI002DE2FADD|nr:Thioredoxin domain-containing protein [Chitinophaga sp. 212800010-3]
MKRVYIIAIISLFFFSNCANIKKSDSDTETATISAGLKKARFGTPKTWMVILPGLGCNGCIQEGEAFMRDFIDSTGIFFILTKVQSLKILQQKIGKSISGRSNVFVDNDGIFNLPTKNVIYPCIVQLKDGEIIKHQFQSPANGQAFEWLKIQLEQ